jgi:molybdopterin-guanine dinucleotide biosynthesis protein MobB
LKIPGPDVKAISVVGPSGSGKTELICRLWAWFESQGLRVAILKHTHKLSLGDEGKDTWRYRQAGARLVCLATPESVQVTQATSGEMPLSRILTGLARDADLILVEGYKYGPLPKVALAGPNPGDLALDYPHLLALVSPEPIPAEVPVFKPEQTAELGRFILQHLPQEKDGRQR